VAKHKVLVVSLCPQSLPFFAVKFDLDIAEATRKLCGFLKGLGEFGVVVGDCWSNDVIFTCMRTLLCHSRVHNIPRLGLHVM